MVVLLLLLLLLLWNARKFSNDTELEALAVTELSLLFVHVTVILSMLYLAILAITPVNA